jgi:hypothetical protein
LKAREFSHGGIIILEGVSVELGIVVPGSNGSKAFGQVDGGPSQILRLNVVAINMGKRNLSLMLQVESLVTTVVDAVKDEGSIRAIRCIRPGSIVGKSIVFFSKGPDPGTSWAFAYSLEVRVLMAAAQ